MALLEIRNLTVSFDTSVGLFKAVEGIDLHVDSREVLAIVGEWHAARPAAVPSTTGELAATPAGAA